MSSLRDLKLLVVESEFDFVKEYQFAERDGRGWLSDFACLDYGILIEYDGLQTWSNEKSGHQTLKGVKNDVDKHNHSALMGFYTLRYNRDNLSEDSFIEHVKKFVVMRKMDMSFEYFCEDCSKRIWVPVRLAIELEEGFRCLLCQWHIDEKEKELKRSKRKRK